MIENLDDNIEKIRENGCKPIRRLIHIAGKLLNRMYYILKNKREYKKGIVQ